MTTGRGSRGRCSWPRWSLAWTLLPRDAWRREGRRQWPRRLPPAAPCTEPGNRAADWPQVEPGPPAERPAAADAATRPRFPRRRHTPSAGGAGCRGRVDRSWCTSRTVRRGRRPGWWRGGARVCTPGRGRHGTRCPGCCRGGCGSWC